MWIYKDKPFEEDVSEYYGFIYCLTFLKTNQKYIGKKLFTKAGYKQVKGKKKRIRKESDWKMYQSSSDVVQNLFTEFGENSFKKEIIRLCKTRSECSYYETKEIFSRDCLLKSEYFNSWVSCKIHKKHLKGLTSEDISGTLSLVEANN